MPPGRHPPADRTAEAPHRASGRATLGAKQRLRRTGQFQEAYDQNRRVHGRHMVLFLHAAPDASSRLGVVASRRVGNAVERARAKRRLREAFRRHRALFTGVTDDVVLVARRSILDAPWAAVIADLLTLAVKSGLMPPSDAP